MGENGAGKSTLGKIIAGVYTADQGVIKIEGQEVKPTDSRIAQGLGIALVHQELAFCPNMTVAENLLLGTLPTKSGFMDWGKLREKARALLHEIGSDIDVDMPLAQLTTGQEQMVQIAGAVGVNARIIIFDEPTSSLSTNESEHLFELMARLKARGVSMIYVSHRMDEIFRICDTITVLRDGKHVATEPIAQTNRDRLIRQMVGREVLMKRPKHLDQEPGEEILRVENLCSTGKFENVSFNVRRGEIVGIGGLVGAGRTEVATAIFGLDPRATGNVFIKGKKLTMGNVNEAMRRRIALLPEDRKRAGLVLGMKISDNVSLAHIDYFSKMGFVDKGREISEVEKLTKRLLCGNFLPSSVPSPYLCALLLTGGAADGGEMHHFFFGRLGPGKFAAQSAVTHDQDAICQGQHFWKITRDDEDRDPFSNQFIEQGIDLGLGPDVDAAGWLVHDQHRWLNGKPFC
jgi:ABC-type sugar transport system ATPase subunit